MIVFDSLNCFNDNKEANFQFVQGQKTSMLNLNCKDCVQVSPTAYVPAPVSTSKVITPPIFSSMVIPTPVTPTQLHSIGPDDHQSGGKKMKGSQAAGISIGIVIVVVIIILIVLFVLKKGNAFNFRKIPDDGEDFIYHFFCSK